MACGENLSKFHHVHHKSKTDWSVDNEHRPPWWATGNRAMARLHTFWFIECKKVKLSCAVRYCDMAIHVWMAVQPHPLTFSTTHLLTHIWMAVQPHPLTFSTTHLLTHIWMAVQPHPLTFSTTHLRTHIWMAVQPHPLTFSTTYLLIPWNRAHLEKLIHSQVVKKFLAFMDPEGSLPHSHMPATCPYP
jgi:uncharacterized membrane protein